MSSCRNERRMKSTSSGTTNQLGRKMAFLAVTLSFLISNMIGTVTAIDEYVVVYQSTSSRGSQRPAEYDCYFENLWTSDRHPNEYPVQGDSIGWSDTVATAHGASFRLFQSNTVASSGVTDFVRTGDTTALFVEMISRGEDIGDISSGLSIDLSRRTTSVIRGIEVDSGRSLLSVMAKLQPGPDWFSGLDSFNLQNTARGKWYSEVVLDLFPFDAGTDSGDKYEVSSGPTVPQGNIVQLTEDNVPSATEVFLSPDGTTVNPVARLKCLLFGTQGPSRRPTRQPSVSPTLQPTYRPSLTQTDRPTPSPVPVPTTQPSPIPTARPTLSPTPPPTASPSQSPTFGPTTSPTISPTETPTATMRPTPQTPPPSTGSPTHQPTTETPATLLPTQFPTVAPILPTQPPATAPSFSPTSSPPGTLQPTLDPTQTPSTGPTNPPLLSPTTVTLSSPAATNSPSPQPTNPLVGGGSMQQPTPTATGQTSGSVQRTCGRKWTLLFSTVLLCLAGFQ